MSHKVKALLVVSGALLATYAFAQDSQQQMTPEQKAEMEAYTKAGTPGAPHKALASTVGTYDLKIKNWHEPGGPAYEETGHCPNWEQPERVAADIASLLRCR